GTFISVVFIALFLYIKELRNGKVFFSKKYWLFCLPIAIPIIFHNLSHLVLNQADRLMLDKLVGDSATGIYSFTYNIGIILNIVNMSINSAWVAWYFDALKDKLFSEIKSMVKNYIVIFTIITGLFLLGAPELVKILSAKTYWGGINLLPIIILGYYFVFLYTFAVNYEFYSKKTKFIALGTIIAAIINIVINVIYIPKIGMYAAAISTLIAYIVLFLMHEFIVRIVLKHKDFPFYYYLLSIAVIGIVTIVSYIFIEYLLIRWAIIIICLILCGIIGYKEFKKYEKKKRGGNGDE
ncbi:MAG: lipopolysaccharide biosynthesis protein, partial [Sarcina sp.]